MLLSLTVLAVFWQVQNHAFIHLDDTEYVTDNIHVRTGLRWNNITWAFTSTHAANWHPLTWLSHMLDCELFGLNPKGHHLTSLLFHLVNSLVLFVLLKRMTGTSWRSGFVAALFAIHPLHVESVAWVAERKDVLSTFFLFLALLSYIWYVERPRFYRYLSIILSFALGLMAKPMLVTLPFLLLLLDFWPLERFKLGPSGNNQTAAHRPPINAKKPWRQALALLMEKIPLFVLAAASSLVTFMVQKSAGSVGSLEIYPFKLRLANALLSYVRYIIKMIWPQNLAVFYPHPGQGLPMWQAALAGLMLVAISTAVIRAGRRYPYLPVGWLWYVGTLVPVIGLVQVGAQAMADRYTYVPLIGLFVMISWGVVDWMGSWRYAKPALTGAAASLLGALMVCTFLQVRYWENSLTLFEHTLRVTNNNSQIHNNLANVLTQKGMLQEAIPHYTKALEINPNNADAHTNLGVALAHQGKLEDAIKHYSEALRLKPTSPELHNNLGVALFRRGHIPGAIDHYLTAVQLKPDYAEAYNNLGNALAQQEELVEAEAFYAKALKIRADYPEAHNNLGVALARQGKLDVAIAHFREAVRLKPDYLQARANLQFALEEIGNSSR